MSTRLVGRGLLACQPTWLQHSRPPCALREHAAPQRAAAPRATIRALACPAWASCSRRGRGERGGHPLAWKWPSCPLPLWSERHPRGDPTAWPRPGSGARALAPGAAPSEAALHCPGRQCCLLLPGLAEAQPLLGWADARHTVAPTPTPVNVCTGGSPADPESAPPGTSAQACCTAPPGACALPSAPPGREDSSSPLHH